MIACVLRLNQASIGESLLVRTLLDHLYPLANMCSNIGAPSLVGLTKTPRTFDASEGSFSWMGILFPLGWGMLSEYWLRCVFDVRGCPFIKTVV